MKKTISLLLVTSLLFSMAACGGSAAGKKEQAQTLERVQELIRRALHGKEDV